MSENYSIVTDINAAPSLAALDSIISKLTSLESKIGQVGAKSLSPRVESPNLSNFFAACDKAEAKVIKVKSQIEAPSTIGGGFSSFLNSEKGKFGNVGKEMGQSLQMGMQQQFGMMGGMASSMATALGPAGIVAGAAVAGGAVIAGAAVNAARAWESLMGGVLKTSGLQKGTADANAMSEALLDLSKQAGMGSQAGLAQIAQLAGGQGIGAKAADSGNYKLQREQILAYTRDVQGMATAFDMTAEESATMGAAVQKSFKLPMDEIHHMGSMVTTVGDSVGVPEKKLLEFLSRAGGSKVALNAGVTATASFGAALMSTGMEAEVAASSITMMESQVLSNDKKMNLWAKTLGVTKEALWEMVDKDFYGTVLKTGDVMSKMDMSKSIPLATEIFGAEVAKYVNKMGGVGEDYATGMAKGNTAFKDGTKLAAVFGEKGATIDSKWLAFSNTMNTAFIHLGTVALPVIGQIIDSMTGIVSIADKLGSALGGAFDKGSTAASKLLKDVAKKTVSGGQGLSGWLNTITGGALGYDEMADPNSPVAKRLAAMNSAPASTLKSDAVAMTGPLMDGTLNTAGNMAGTAYGDALGNALKTKIPKAVSDGYLAASGVGVAAGKAAGDVFGEGFLKALKESKVSEQIATLIYGKNGDKQLEDLDALRIINAQSVDTSAYFSDPSIKKRFSTILGDAYAIQAIANKRVQGGGGTLNLLDATGKAIKSSDYVTSDINKDIDAITKMFEESVQPVVLDLPKKFRNAGTEIAGTLRNALEDGLIDPLNEKPMLEGLLKQIDALQKANPLEFSASNLPELRKDIEDSLKGIKVDIDKSQLETNYAMWRRDNVDLYEKIYTTLKPLYGDNAAAIPTDTSERALHDELLRADNERLNLLYSQIDKSVTSGDYADAEVLPEVITEIAGIDPDILALSATTQRLDSIEQMYGMQVKQVGDSYVVVDKNGQTLATTHLTVSAAGKILGNGLTDLASAAYEAATALRGLKGGYAGLPMEGPTMKSKYADARYTTLNWTTPNTEYATPSAKTMSSAYASLWPRLAKGGKVVSEGLAWLGDGGEDEYVIPESELKGANALSGYRPNTQNVESKSVSITSMPKDSLVSGLTKEGYIATYDTRTETCDLLSFAAPDPSLKTSDPFYLGLTKNSPANVAWDQGGWAGQVAQASTPELAEQIEASRNAQEESASSGKETAKNTAQTASGIAGLSSGIQGALVAAGGYGSSSNIIGLANRGGGAYWGGTSINGGGSWIGGGSTMVGGRGYVPWGGAAKVGGTGIYSSGGGGGSSYSLPPVFMANEAYVKSPTLAVVGDRPGGEYVVGASRFENAVGKMGGSPSITINSPITIQGNGDAASLDAVLAARNREIIDEVTEKVVASMHGL